MTRILLSKPAILCAANANRSSFSGESNILSAFQNGTTFLQKDSSFLGREIFIGTCDNLLPLPQGTNPHFITRTNAILYTAILQIEPLILQLKDALGANNIGVSIGTTTTGIGENYQVIAQYYEAMDASATIDFSKIKYVGERSALCNPADFLKAYFGLDSLSFGVSSACTSGGKAIIQGARMIKSNLCKAVICGGVDSLNHLTLAGFNSLEILSANRSKPFSAERDGINIGEGAGIFVMISENVLDSHPNFSDDFKIALLAHKSNNDAYHITQPSPKMQGGFLQGFGSVDYINLHGTGTIANDEMEAQIIAQNFQQTPCSTIKPFIGHTLGAAGGIELGICAELILDSLKNGESPLPPHIYESAFENLSLVKKSDKKCVKTALSTSFAFGGDNSAIKIGVRQ